MTISEYINNFSCLPSILFILPENDADYKDNNASWDTIWDDKTDEEIAYLNENYEVEHPERGINSYGAWDEGDILVRLKV